MMFVMPSGTVLITYKHKARGHDKHRLILNFMMLTSYKYQKLLNQLNTLNITSTQSLHLELAPAGCWLWPKVCEYPRSSGNTKLDQMGEDG